MPTISRRVLLALPVARLPLHGSPAQKREAPVFRGNASLVLVPATVVDGDNRFVHGLGEADFELYDGDDRQPIALELEPAPISLVVAAHATVSARKPLEELRKAASLFGPLVVGEGGEAALVAIRDTIEVVADFSPDFDRIAAGLRSLEAHGAGCSFIDAVTASVRLLSARPTDHRKVIVIMAEARDHSSKGELREALLAAQKAQVTVFALTYSPGAFAFKREVPVGP